MKISNEFGFCEYDFECDKFGKYVHIYNLYIYPKHRRKGHAKKLLLCAISEIRNKGWTSDIFIVAMPIENSITKQKLEDFYKSLELIVFDSYIQ